MRFLKKACLHLLTALTLAFPACAMIENHPLTPVPPATQEEQDTMLLHVEKLCEYPRYGATIHHARNYIAAHFRAAGWQVSQQKFTTSDGETHYNICALRPGKKDTRYIIGAHYDACDIGDDGVNHGADDNASAVAALLELATRLPKEGQEHTIELVAWACEEPPWFGTEDMGSAHHAAACDKEKVLGLICLEMLGFYSDKPGSQPELFPGYGWMLPTTGNFITVVGDPDSRELSIQVAHALKAHMPTARVNLPFTHGTELYFSDHRNYWPLGIPSLMVTDTSMLRNHHYHEPTDIPATLDYNRLALVTRGIVQAVRNLAFKP